MLDLGSAGRVIVERLALSCGDAFVIVCNPELPHSGDLVGSVAAAARARSAHVTVLEYPAGSRDGEEPPATVAEGMRRATALVLLTRFSISHTTARTEATRGGARIASMPGISRETFARALVADYDRLGELGARLAPRLSDGASCRVTSKAGTDVLLSLRGRRSIVDDGNLRSSGAFGNLPAGEVYIAPCEADADGTIVFDGSLAEWGILDEPLTISLRRGRAIEIGGGRAARWLRQTLDAGGFNGRVIAELGIGTNTSARVSGDILEDEKAAGTAHFAFGTNTSMGGNNQASVHLDGLILQPRVEIDGLVVLDEGCLLI